MIEINLRPGEGRKVEIYVKGLGDMLTIHTSTETWEIREKLDKADAQGIGVEFIFEWGDGETIQRVSRELLDQSLIIITDGET